MQKWTWRPIWPGSCRRGAKHEAARTAPDARRRLSPRKPPSRVPWRLLGHHLGGPPRTAISRGLHTRPMWWRRILLGWTGSEFRSWNRVPRS